MPDLLAVTDLIALFGMRPLPQEGGWFVETWRGTMLPPAATPNLATPHAAGTAILYLVTPDGFSAMHRLPTDEVFHFYAGDPVEQLHLLPGGQGQVVRLGHDFAAGERPQVVAPAAVWQGTCLAPGGPHGYALLGTTMAPGFSPDDYEHGERAALIAGWPAWATQIGERTRDTDG